MKKKIVSSSVMNGVKMVTSWVGNEGEERLMVRGDAPARQVNAQVHPHNRVTRRRKVSGRNVKGRRSK